MDQMMSEVKVPKRILNTLLSSLAAGVVPRVGAPYIAIGREDEIAAGKCSVKNMVTGEQVKLPVAEAATYIKNALAANNGPIILEK